MNILSETTALIEGLGIPVETGAFSDVASDEYMVVTPLSDTYELFSDNHPEFDTQETRLSLYSKGNYLAMKNRVLKALLVADLTVIDRLYIEHEDNTGYHHYAIDIAKIHPIEE